MADDKGINAHLRELANKHHAIKKLQYEMTLLETCLRTNHGEMTEELKLAIRLAKAGTVVEVGETKQ